MLKFWVLLLSYKCPKKSGFCCFYGYILTFHEFPLVKFSKLFRAHRIQWDTYFKHEKSRACKGMCFFDFCKLCILPLEKLVL